MREIDTLMEAASGRLVAMEYLAAEALCLRALGMARAAGDWTDYARILMPLQECRRQRRMIACDTSIQLGTTDGYALLERGCLVLTRPQNHEDAKILARRAEAQGLYIEVLLCDSEASDPRWTLTTSTGPNLRCGVEAPRGVPLDRPLDPEAYPHAAQWFVKAAETLGDQALAAVSAPLGTEARVEELERMVAAVGDHELLHQALGDAARALRGTP